MAENDGSGPNPLHTPSELEESNTEYVTHAPGQRYSTGKGCYSSFEFPREKTREAEVDSILIGTVKAEYIICSPLEGEDVNGIVSGGEGGKHGGVTGVL